MSFCCSIGRSTTPGDLCHHLADLLGRRAQLVQIVAEDLDRDVGAGAREHVVDAVGDRLADDDLRCRGRRTARHAAAARNSSLRRSPIFEVGPRFRRLRRPGVLASSARPVTAGGGDHLGDATAGSARRFARARRTSSSEVPGSVTVLMVSVPSLKSGRKARPRTAGARWRTASNATDGGHHLAEWVSVASQRRRVGRLQPTRRRRGSPCRGRPRARAGLGAQHRRHGDRHQQRGRERDHIGEAQRHAAAAPRPRTGRRAAGRPA